MGTPLPNNHFPTASEEHIAYDRTLDLERSSLNSGERMTARVLGYMLIHLDQRARIVVANEIRNCPNPESEHALAKLYIMYFVREYRSRLF